MNGRLAVRVSGAVVAAYLCFTLAIMNIKKYLEHPAGAGVPQAEALRLILSASCPRIVKVIAERPGLAAAFMPRGSDYL